VRRAERSCEDVARSRVSDSGSDVGTTQSELIGAACTCVLFVSPGFDTIQKIPNLHGVRTTFFVAA